MPNLVLDGKRAHIHDGGVAWEPGRPWIALVHGAGCTHVVWQSQSRALAHAGYNVLVPDLPGHGQSDDVPEVKSVADYAQWVRRAFQAAAKQADANGAPLMLVGHSLGACIAVSYAAAWPAEVSALALVGAALEMKVNPSLLQDCLNDQPTAVAFLTSYGHGRTTHLAAATSPGAWVMGADQALMLASHPPVLQRDFAVCAAWGGPADAPRVSAPTLVVSGALDRLTPAKAGKQLADAIPNARYEVLPGAGHMLPSEAPRGLLRLLQGFLARLPNLRAA